ncbi:hypothetical protein GQ457_01G017000 [Hibiscus cannabinus]
MNGRPPSLVPCVQFGLVLKRPRSPSDVHLKDDYKRFWEQDGGGFQVDPFESMEMEEKGGRFEVSVPNSHDQTRNRANQSVPARVSYANLVCNSDCENMSAQDDLDLDPDRVVVLDEDCVVNHNGKFPTIIFFERVHEQIDSNMNNTLLNRIHAMWKPSGELQLIDLDNNYFLVWIEDPRDYGKILTEGAWTIYDSCVVGRAKDNSMGKSPIISVKPNISSVVTENSDALFGPWMVAKIKRQRQQSSSTVINLLLCRVCMVLALALRFRNLNL